MPIITTGKLGLNEADPKPVHQVNWLGHPMKEGESYRGESKPQEKAPDAPKAPRVKKVKRSWTKEQIEAMRARMANARAKRRAAVNNQQQQGET